MLIYYHGTTKNAIDAILKNGIDISKGCGELGKGFYVGSSLWRAYSWAWHKSQKNGIAKDYGVIEFQLDEVQLNKLNILCKNTRSTISTYNGLKQCDTTQYWISNHDAIWAPIVGKNIKNVFQIKFESEHGKQFIQQQKQVLWSQK